MHAKAVPYALPIGLEGLKSVTDVHPSEHESSDPGSAFATLNSSLSVSFTRRACVTPIHTECRFCGLPFSS